VRVGATIKAHAGLPSTRRPKGACGSLGWERGCYADEGPIFRRIEFFSGPARRCPTARGISRGEGPRGGPRGVGQYPGFSSGRPWGIRHKQMRGRKLAAAGRPCLRRSTATGPCGWLDQPDKAWVDGETREGRTPKFWVQQSRGTGGSLFCCPASPPQPSVPGGQGTRGASAYGPTNGPPDRATPPQKARLPPGTTPTLGRRSYGLSAGRFSLAWPGYTMIRVPRFGACLAAGH